MHSKAYKRHYKINNFKFLAKQRWESDCSNSNFELLRNILSQIENILTLCPVVQTGWMDEIKEGKNLGALPL